MSSSRKARASRRYRYGFKKEADEYAREFRAELGLSPEAPLDPRVLAQSLGIPLLPLSALLRQQPEAARYLMGAGRSCFSAATVFDGRRRTILYNDAHHPVRQSADISHELAHGILGHPAAPPLGEGGCRNFDRQLEDEADWLGPALLVSKEAAFWVVNRGMPVDQACRLYAVSSQLMQMRLNVSGAPKIMARARKKRSSLRG